eukprot:g10940.t1 g10940   contig46:34328-36330(+)
MSNANVNPDEAAAATSLATLSTLNGTMLTTMKMATTTTPFSKPNKPKKNATTAAKGKRGAMVDRIYSLYNLFFILERKIILRKMGDSNPEPTSTDRVVYEGYDDIIAAIPPLPPRYQSLTDLPRDWFIHTKTKAPRSHKKTHGLLSFNEIARLVSDNWAKVDVETLTFLKDINAMMRSRHQELKLKLLKAGAPLKTYAKGQAKEMNRLLDTVSTPAGEQNEAVVRSDIAIRNKRGEVEGMKATMVKSMSTESMSQSQVVRQQNQHQHQRRRMLLIDRYRAHQLASHDCDPTKMLLSRISNQDNAIIRNRSRADADVLHSSHFLEGSSKRYHPSRYNPHSSAADMTMHSNGVSAMPPMYSASADYANHPYSSLPLCQSTSSASSGLGAHQMSGNQGMEHYDTSGMSAAARASYDRLSSIEQEVRTIKQCLAGRSRGAGLPSHRSSHLHSSTMQMMQSHPPYHSRPTTENNIVHVPVVDISMQSYPPYHSRPTTENNIIHVPVVDIFIPVCGTASEATTQASTSLSEETVSTASDTAITTGEVTSLTGDDDRNAAEDLFEVLKERAEREAEEFMNKFHGRRS